jgi:CRP-like cAMP-binding protein
MRRVNAFMVREREIRVFPGARGRVATSLSSVAGHVSFLLLGYSYMTSDLLTLRALAIGGLSAAVVFQYFRDVPLWLPIRWNALFVAINVFWVAKLYYDEYNAEHWCTTEERSLYDRHFSHMALNSFRTLLKHGKWRDIERGFEFTKEGKMNENVHVLIDGSAEVYVGGKSVNSIDAGSFIGEMSLMRSIAGSNAKKQSKRPRAASATVVAAERCRVFSWDDGELRQLIQQNEQIKSGVQAAFGVGLAEKLLTTRVMSTKVFAQEPQRVSHALA